MTPTLVGGLKEWYLRSPTSADDQLKFGTETGEPENYSNATKRGPYAALKRAGLPLVGSPTPRHTYGSALIRPETDIATVSRSMGHGSVAVALSISTHL